MKKLVILYWYWKIGQVHRVHFLEYWFSYMSIQSTIYLVVNVSCDPIFLLNLQPFVCINLKKVPSDWSLQHISARTVLSVKSWHIYSFFIISLFDIDTVHLYIWDYLCLQVSTVSNRKWRGWWNTLDIPYSRYPRIKTHQGVLWSSHWM